MNPPYSFKVAGHGIRRGGHRKPSILATWNDLNRMDLDHFSVVEVSVPGGSEGPIYAFVEGTVNAEIDDGTIATTETLDRALPDGVGRVNLVDSEPPEADKIRVGRPLDVHVSMTFRNAPEEMVEEATGELLEEFESHRGRIYAGCGKRAERGDGQRGVTVSAEVKETVPGQVAMVTEETDVLIKGRDYR